MANKGVKFRTGTDGERIVFTVNAGYTITGFRLYGISNYALKDGASEPCIKATTVEVDGTEATFDGGGEFPAKGSSTSGAVVLSGISATETIAINFDNSNTSGTQINGYYELDWETVDAAQPLSTTVTPASATIATNSPFTLTGTFTGGSFSGQWVSDNESVATVDQNGIVTGISAGTANITFQWADDQSQDAYKASAEITVVEANFDANMPKIKAFDFTSWGATSLQVDENTCGNIYNAANDKNNPVYPCTISGLEDFAFQYGSGTTVYVENENRGWTIKEEGLYLGSKAGRCAAIMNIKAGQYVEFYYTGDKFYTKSDNSDSGIQKVACVEEEGHIVFYAIEDGMIGFELTKGNAVTAINVYEEGATSLITTSMDFSETSVNVALGDSFTAPTLNTDPAGLAVTYSSTNEDVATIDPSTGEVTIVGIGSTTIRANFAGDDSYLASSASYTLNVTMTPIIEKVWNFAEWEEADYEETTIIDDLQLNAKTGAKLAINSSVLKFGGSGKVDQRSIRFRLAAGPHIIALLAKSASGTTTTDKETGDIKYVDARPLRISFGGFGGNDIMEFSMVAGATLTENYINCNTAEDTDVYVYSGNSGINLSSLIVTDGASLPITIGKSGLNTLVAPFDIDFTLDTSLEAYVAVAAENGYVTLEQVQQAPANTPLILKAEPGLYYEALTYGAAAPAVNLLKAGDSQTTIGGDYAYDYVLKGGEFCRASEGGNPTYEGIVPNGKAYLSLEAPASRTLQLVFGEATGISSVKTAKAEGSIYTLSGARVAQPQKGLYIQDGKKLIVK